MGISFVFPVTDPHPTWAGQSGLKGLPRTSPGGFEGVQGTLSSNGGSQLRTFEKRA